MQRRRFGSWSGGESLRVAVKGERSKHQEDVAVEVLTGCCFHKCV